jgi:flagellar biosynthetic protein FlhB
VSDDSEQNKSEQPTSFKLSKAREKGNVARGTDLGFLTGLAAFAFYAWVSGPDLAVEIGRAAADAVVAAPNVVGGANEIMAVTGLVLSRVSGSLIFMALTVFLVVMLFEIVQTGVIFSAQPLKPDFSRMNPAKGLKRLFTVKLLQETIKNVLKLSVYSLLTWLAIRAVVRTDVASVTDAGSLLDAMGRTAFKLIAWVIGAAILFAAIDQLIVRRHFLKQMRMSRREVRRESRDREGEPRIKQRRKQLHAEFTKASESLRAVPGADVVITNPTHFAVALRYDPARMAAPAVVSLGANAFALRIKRLAFLHNILIVEDKKLARQLFRACQVNQPVPEDCYARVADIYLAIRRRAAAGSAGEAAHV